MLAGLLSLAGLLILNSLMSAARSALVNARRPLLARRAEEGSAGARLALRVVDDSTRLIATIRLVQTTCRLLVAGLAVLWGVPGIAGRLPSQANAELIAAVGLILVTGLAMVTFGELMPEMSVLREPERWAVRLAPLVAGLEWLLGPVIGLALRVTRLVSGPLAGELVPFVTEEEIKTLVDAGEEGGVLEQEEKEMIYSIFQFGDTVAREVMVPRIDMVGIEAGTTLADASRVFLESGHSRVPVYEGSLDHILGFLYAKDLLKAWKNGEQDQPVHTQMRQVYFVPETKKVDELLAELQSRRVHVAIVIDEYGGTAGLVTLEDIVEEIVGEIRDEYDVDEEMPYAQVGAAEYLFDGRIDLDDVNDLMQSTLPTQEDDTLGGFVYSTLGRVPSAGEEIRAGGLRLVVEQVVGRRIRKVRAWRLPPEPPPDQAPERSPERRPERAASPPKRAAPASPPQEEPA